MLKKQKKSVILFCLVLYFINSPAAFPDNGNGMPELTPEVLLRELLKKNPELEGMRHMILSKKAEADQQSRLINPELEVEIENFGGSGAFRGFDGSELSIALSQDFFTAGKKALSVRYAEGERRLSEIDLEIRASDLALEAMKHYYGLLFLQELKKLMRVRSEMADEFEKLSAGGVKEGKTSSSEYSRIRIYRMRCISDLRSVESRINSAKTRIAMLMGQSSLPYQTVAGSLFSPDITRVFAVEKNTNPSSPELAAAGKEFDQSRIILDLQKAIRIPDIKISGGIKRHSESGLTAFTAGLSIPIPVFNSNRGGIRSARSLVDRASARIRTEELRIRAGISEMTAALNLERENIIHFREEIIPELEDAVMLVKNSYMAGRSTYIEVIDIYESAYEIRSAYISSLKDLNILRAEIERLNGNILGFFMTGGNNE